MMRFGRSTILPTRPRARWTIFVANKRAMWRLHQTCELYGQLPSQRLGVANSWAAYQLDNAVTFLAVAIQNALDERVNRGTERNPDRQPRYTLSQLLHPAFRLPLPPKPQPFDAMGEFLQQLLSYSAQPGSGIRQWRYVGGDTA
jgi:hypothetical protein